VLADRIDAPPRESPAQPSSSSLPLALLPWAGYLAVTLLLLRDLLPLVADHLPGETDGWQNVWNLWWMRHSLLDLHTNPFYSDYIYYPIGSSLLFHTYAPLNGVLALPLTVTLGPLPTVNLLVIGSFVFTAMAAYALARGLGISMFGAWLAGAIYSFCNPARWHYFGGGQADHLAMQWMPLYILCLVKATALEFVSERKSKFLTFWLLAGAAFLACTGLTDWQHFVYMGVFTGLYALYLLVRERGRPGSLFAMRNIAIMVGGGVLLLSSLLYASIREALASTYMVRPLEQTIGHSWDLTTYFTPNSANPLWGGWAAAQNFPGNAYGNVLGVGNSGYLPLLLAIAGLLYYRRRAWQWAVIGLIFAVLSLGPFLHVNGADRFGPDNVQISLPYNLLLDLPFFSISRDPSRFSLTAYLCVGLLAGFGWMGITSRLRPVSTVRPWARYSLAGAVALVTLGEFMAIAYPITTQPVSPFFQTLGKDPATYALLEVPVADKFYAEYTQSLESIHHKKIMGGQTARKPCYCFAMDTPVVRWFWDLGMPKGRDIVLSQPDPATYAPAILRYFDMRYIIIYKWMLKPEDYARAQTLVHAIMPGVAPVADDNAITAYTVPPTSTTTVMPVLLSDDWGQVEQGSLGTVRWVSDKGATFRVVNATLGKRTAKLGLKLQAFHDQRTLVVSNNGRHVASMTIKPELQDVTMDLPLDAGNNDVYLSSPEPAISPSSLDPASSDNRLLSFAVLSLDVR
jgi:hypothetical protein